MRGGAICRPALGDLGEWANVEFWGKILAWCCFSWVISKLWLWNCPKEDEEESM